MIPAMPLLPLVFAVVIGAAVLAYVVLDGYDLGVGMLMPAATRQEQAYMVSSIGPFWDANETWLVLGVGLFLVAFPVAYGMVLEALYLPVVAMLIGLMLRGVAFEFRVKADGWHRELWNALFWAGSFVASLAQGFMLGRYITGFESGFGFVMFGLLVGGGLCGGYVLLGATWLIMLTDGALKKKACAWARWGLAWVALGVASVSFATPLVSETMRRRWFDFPGTIWLVLLPAASIAAGVLLWRETGRLHRGESRRDWLPFSCAVAIFVLAFCGLTYSLFPFVVMDRLTIWEAASHPSSLRIVLIGTVVVLPFIVAYTVILHRVFRGKADAELYS